MRMPYPNELYHHGILGMKWGIRRYQRPDGSLTEAGKKRYNNNGKFDYAKAMKDSRSGKLDVDQMVTRNAQIQTNDVLNRIAYMSVKMLPITSGDEKEMVQKILDATNKELIDRASNRIISKDDPNIFFDKRLGDEFFDDDHNYGWDDDGNPIYNKSNAQISEERSGNSKLRNMTDAQYKSIDRDLAEIGGRQYAKQSLSVRQKLIKDYYETPRPGLERNGTLNDEYQRDTYNSYDHGPRPTNQQALQNQYDIYLKDHPNSELTFTEFNGWFYES